MTVDFRALVNGSWADALPLQDRGLMYGDGVFRTLRLQAGHPVWWPDHYSKLTDDCSRIDLPAPTESEWQADLAQLASRLPDATIKLMVTRGVGQRGYRVPDPAACNRIAIAYPAAEENDPGHDGLNHGIVARVCDLRLGSQPRLAGIKHLNRLENVLARMEWNDPAIREGLLLDEGGQVIGGTSSNLFLLDGETLSTPRLDRCGIAGVARSRLMRAAGRLGLDVEVTNLSLDRVLAADAVFMSSSLIRLRWVNRIGERYWQLHPGFHPLLESLDA